MADICASRDDAQPHVYRDGHCVFCLAPNPAWKQTSKLKSNGNATRDTLVSERLNLRRDEHD